MRNVFQLFSNVKTEFTALEKTLLGDIAMDFRDKGVRARFCLMPTSQIALAKFIDFETSHQYIHISKHREQGVIEYQVSHSMKPAETYLNFQDALIDCRNYIASRNSLRDEASIINLMAYRRA